MMFLTFSLQNQALSSALETCSGRYAFSSAIFLMASGERLSAASWLAEAASPAFDISRLHGSSTSCFKLLQISKKFSNVLIRGKKRHLCVSGPVKKFKLMLFKGQLCFHLVVRSPWEQRVDISYMWIIIVKFTPWCPKVHCHWNR